MKRLFVILGTFAFSISISAKNPQDQSLALSAGFVFQGTLTSQDGKPVRGAEVDLIDASGKLVLHGYSDLRGSYQLPALLSSAEEAKSLRIEISHVRHQAVRVNDVMAGAWVGPPALVDLAGSSAVPLLASLQRVRRDLVLTPAPGVSPESAPLLFDPNYAEYCYQQGLILMAQNKNQEAIAYHRLYAQIGGNPLQIGESLQFLSEHEK